MTDRRCQGRRHGRDLSCFEELTWYFEKMLSTEAVAAEGSMVQRNVSGYSVADFLVRIGCGTFDWLVQLFALIAEIECLLFPCLHSPLSYQLSS